MRRGRFSSPPSVASATERFKQEADPMRGFIDERTEFVHKNNAPFCPRTDVYMAYTTWAAVNGFHQMSAARFYESFAAACVGVSEHPFRVAVRDGVRGYYGVVIT
jgi:phage/plasmid-associated DNA primase